MAFLSVYNAKSLFDLDGVKVSITPQLHYYGAWGMCADTKSKNFFKAALLVLISDTGGLSRNRAKRVVRGYMRGGVCVRFSNSNNS